MITATLACAVIWCTFYGRLHPAAVIALCVAAVVGLIWANRQPHGPLFSIDVFAQYSKLNRVNPSLKLWFALILMALCVASKSPWAGIFLTVIMLCLTVFAGGLGLPHYVRLLSLPLSFLLVSGLALLFEISTEQRGIISLPIFGAWLSVSTASQVRAALVMARALGAVSCLYLLSLTTHMSGINGALRRARCPAVFVSMMYLVYRYIFILYSMYYIMHDAAESRLGFADYRKSLSTTAKVYSGLLMQTYRKASVNFDAMESRCFDTNIRFLEHRQKITVPHAVTAIIISAVTLWISLWA